MLPLAARNNFSDHSERCLAKRSHRMVQEIGICPRLNVMQSMTDVFPT